MVTKEQALEAAAEAFNRLNDIDGVYDWGAQELAIRRCIEQSQPVPEWQPIDTAPRDGTLVDIYVPKFGRFTNVWWEADARLSEVQRLGHAWVHSRGIVTDGANATHWMSLPAAPNPACSGCLGYTVHNTCGKEPKATPQPGGD